MNKHGHRNVRKVNDGRPKPYLGRIWVMGVERQTAGFATALEASEAARQLRQTMLSQAASCQHLLQQRGTQ